jgi:antitoxin (DNA-binding transcriptional repressor) of toxin-antitoxin stability system
MDDVLRVSATEFKARCLAIFRDLEARRIGRVLVTQRGRPVAELMPPHTKLPTLWGAHRGSVEVMPGVGLTEPVIEAALDAAEARR